MSEHWPADRRLAPKSAGACGCRDAEAPPGGLCLVRMDPLPERWCRIAQEEKNLIVYTRGGAFIEDKYRAGEALARAVAQAAAKGPAGDPLGSIRALIGRLNGFWAIVVQAGEREVLAAVDRVRSIPLFYACGPASGAAVAPSVDRLLDDPATQTVDPEAAVEFLLSGYVMGHRTLLSGIHQVEPGEIVQWRRGELVQTRHYRFLRHDFSDGSEEKLLGELECVLRGAFARFATAFGGERLIVPLSGGIDSRLVAALLKQQGCQDVVALAYGQPENRESAIAQQVADALRISLEFQPYHEGEWHRLASSDAMRSFWRFAAQGVSLPHLQDYLALDKRARSGTGAKARVLPGIEAMITGEAAPRDSTYFARPFDVRQVCDDILKRRYCLWPARADELQPIASRLEAFFATAALSSGQDSQNAFYLWEFENRQARYIVNSVRAYEYVGWEWWHPLCDNEIMDFFARTAPRWRFDRRLYVRCILERVFRGPLAALSQIPVVGSGAYAWSGRPRPRCGSMRRTVARLLGSCVPGPLWRKVLIRRARRRDNIVLRFDEWFAATQSEAASRTLGDLMDDPQGPFQGLPLSLLGVLSAQRTEPLCLVNPLGLLAAAVLADVCRTVADQR